MEKWNRIKYISNKVGRPLWCSTLSLFLRDHDATMKMSRIKVFVKSCSIYKIKISKIQNGTLDFFTQTRLK